MFCCSERNTPTATQLSVFFSKITLTYLCFDLVYWCWTVSYSHRDNVLCMLKGGTLKQQHQAGQYLTHAKPQVLVLQLFTFYKSYEESNPKHSLNECIVPFIVHVSMINYHLMVRFIAVLVKPWNWYGKSHTIMQDV